ncbi:hypothetical protein H9N28_03385 [Rhodobacter capsulatus]|uniref:hypothetical protein n=1 Tax=Rhodobacter capsulatus TaxID=1061 RepID=UPI0006DC8F43|nr:hypothetical protein [Rhodobacter capsulatus]KQB15293.1 hypothetical protein AP073_14600 [Rhodobacter capsulatus]KQB16103.1 hypothetical protein AP071_13105 [Rhodobacter capsulatus]PZX25585.1 hypothetical protein LY44_01368 [Rhodobacter capsulatus]QNR63892.1 hypothetical protein H9N28_03385 [Rhodobacter capsulatus]
MSENEKQMAAFIEALKPHIQSLVEEQLGGFKKHAEKLLDEVQDAKRAAKADPLFEKLEQQERDRRRESLNLVTQPDGSVRLASGKGDHGNAVVLDRESARNPQKYREAKAAAAARGVPLVIAEDGIDPTIRNTDRREVMQSKVFTFDDRHEMVRWLRADMQTDSGLVNRRLAAEREGFKVRTFHTLDDLPAHARQKFEMMEAAANAQADS